MTRLVNTLSHRIGPVDGEGRVLKIASGAEYDPEELGVDVSELPGQVPADEYEPPDGDGSEQASGTITTDAGGTLGASGSQPAEGAQEPAQATEGATEPEAPAAAEETVTADEDAGDPGEPVTPEQIATAAERSPEPDGGAAGPHPVATEAAVKLAEELGVQLEQVEGTGADGKITVEDVRGAKSEED